MGQPKDSEFKDRDTMTLDLDDGGKLECIVLNVFPVNNREYIALLPMNDEGHVDEDAQIFQNRRAAPSCGRMLKRSCLSGSLRPRGRCP